ncbi:MAG: ABC transporter ATP-binding protein [Hyphomicrobiales bacterium]|nr:ABC transporter ATP-binding protein [Hyphomicrobiales bacterium]
MLSVADLHTYYGDSHIIQGVSIAVQRGKVVALLGRNGAGKTTTLRTIMNMTPPRSGTITVGDRNITNLKTYEIAQAGIAFVQETRSIFPSLSVDENLTVAERPGPAGNAWTKARVYDEFPSLAARRKNGGAQLSGGEQQMLAIARALVANPLMMLLDEPSEGLAPLIVRQISDLLGKLKQEGMTMLLVEQNFAMAIEVADQAIVLGKGRVRWSGSCAALPGEQDICHTWLGV